MLNKSDERTKDLNSNCFIVLLIFRYCCVVVASSWFLFRQGIALHSYFLHVPIWVVVAFQQLIFLACVKMRRKHLAEQVSIEFHSTTTTKSSVFIEKTYGIE